MKLIFEKSVPGRRCTILPACDVERVSLPASLRRETKPLLPEMSETDISRHYTELCKQVTPAPSKAGPQATAQQTKPSLPPSAISPLVPMSRYRNRPALSARPEASSPAVMSPPT